MSTALRTERAARGASSGLGERERRAARSMAGQSERRARRRPPRIGIPSCGPPPHLHRRERSEGLLLVDSLLLRTHVHLDTLSVTVSHLFLSPLCLSLFLFHSASLTHTVSLLPRSAVPVECRSSGSGGVGMDSWRTSIVTSYC